MHTCVRACVRACLGAFVCVNMLAVSETLAQEWIDFHLMVGFDHFYLYNNNSTDSPEEELAKYIQRGQVTMHDFPSQFRVAYDGVRENYSQKAAVLDALTRYRCQAK